MKSQTSVEFLLVVTMIFLVIVGIFSANYFLQTITTKDISRELWASERIGVEYIQIGASGNMIVRNNNPFDIILLNGTLFVDDASYPLVLAPLSLLRYSQTDIFFEVLCDLDETYSVTAHWVFMHTLSGVEEEIFFETPLLISCT